MPSVTSNDLAGYGADRASRAQESAGDALLKEFAAQQSATQQGGTPPSQPQPPSSPPAGTLVAPASAAANSSSDLTLSDLITGRRPQTSLPVRIAKDIGGGIVESPFAVVGGIRNAYQNTINLGKDVGDWVEQKLSLPVLMIDHNGVRLVSNEEAKGQRLSDLAQLPDADILHPKTVTGSLIQGVAQFLTGMKGVGKLAEAAGIPNLEGAAGYGLSAVKGAVANFTAFDPHQQRLSNLIERFPQLSNPVTQYLESSPDDSNAEGRFKNSLEGLGLGALSDGLAKAVGFLGRAALVKSTAEGVPSTPEAPGVSQDAFKGLGEESTGTPLVSRPTPVAETLTGAEPQSGQVKINFARIDTPDDVKQTIQELANARASDIQAAQRGTQTFEDIKLNASQQNAWDILQQRRVGEPLNAEQSVASRELWATTATRVQELAQEAVTSPNESNLFAFRKMLAVHAAVQEQVLGARTETARALASWRIPVGSDAYRLQEIASRLGDFGGADVNRDLAQRVLSLSTSSDESAALKLSDFASKSAYAKTRDAVLQAYGNALLTSLTTQTRILASNVTTTLWTMGERAWAAKISQTLGNDIQPGEVAAQWSGLVGGIKDALAYASSAWKTGVTGQGIGEPHEQFPSNISSEAFGLQSESWLGRAADYLGYGLSIGQRAVAAQHDVALTLAYRMELNALALRQATSEVNAGEGASDKLNERVASILANPPDSMLESARAQAKYQAFLDEPGALTQWLLKGRSDIPALRVIAPFLKIPSRIMSYTMQRTPLAPLMSEFRAKYAQGGEARDQALAQVSLGSFIALAAADLTMAGKLKGSGPPEKGLEQAQEREGELHDSMLVGDRWYNINGVHPIGKLMLMAADATQAISAGQQELHDNTDAERIVVGTTLAIARQLTDSSYMKGFADLFGMLHDAKVGGTGESALLSTAGSAIPAAVASVQRATDPYQRAVYSLMDEYKSRIPGLSQTLPPRRNLWGDPVPSRHDPLTSLISPVQMSDAKHEPIDDEILKQGFNIEMPDTHQTFGGRAGSVAIDMRKYPAAYSRLLQLSGNELEHPAWGVGLKDLLNSIVSGTHPLSGIYNLKSDGPEGGKEIMIRDLISQYRDLAKKQLLDEYPAIANEVQEKQDARQALKLGGIAVQ